jgi:hypothetical protein
MSDWILDGARVRGLYLETFPVEGIVIGSRVCYGGGVKYMVALDKPMDVYGALRETVNIFDPEVING